MPHPQWGQEHRVVLWFGVGTGSRVGSFPKGDDVVPKSGGGEVVQGMFIEGRKE